MSEAWSQWEGHVVNDAFHLKKYLGGSEQSAVFLTENRGGTPQPAAIKLSAADPSNAQLQLLRWSLAQKLSHPHLLRILHTGRCRLGTRELIFAVMEYAEENLAQIVPERALTPEEAREMLGPTVEALTYLHGQGFVHGRLKPANILAVNDQLKLAGDCIRQANEPDSDAGKPSVYDPPEMAAGVRSPAGDIWSLGMTLVEVLTQCLPSWNQHDQQDPVLPENLPAPFLAIVRGCLRRDPQSRLISVTSTRARFYAGPPQQIAHVAAATPTPQKPPAVSSKGKPWVWRSAFPLVVMVLGIAALIAGFGLLHRQPDTQPEVAAVKPEQKPEPQKSDARKPSPRIRVTPAPPMNPQPASLRSEAHAPVFTGASGASGVVRQVLPDVPETASDTIQGTVRVGVRVNVDSSGTVVGAELDSLGPSKYFARLSLQAAQNWKFAPYGQASGREYIVHFEFTNTGTRAFATRAGP